MRIAGKSVFGLLIMLFMTYIVINSFEYNTTARMFPFVVGILTLGMITLQFLGDTFRSMGDRLLFLNQKGLFTESVVNDSEKEDHKKIEPASETKDPSGLNILVIFLWLIGFVILLHYTSYILAIPVFLFLVIWITGKEKFLPSLGVALGSAAVMYLLFDVLLNVGI